MSDLTFSNLNDSQSFGGHVVPEANALNLSNPDSILSGQNRGTQRVSNTDGSYVLVGNLPDNTFGIGFFDANNNLVSKNIGQTQYVYDITTGKNIIQIGKLPDGTYGFVAAKTGLNVADAFS